ncbi:MAG: HTH domain-containing protein [Nanoarchaeota archaeon]
MAEKVKTREITVVEENGAFAAFFKKFTQDPEYDFEGLSALRKLLSNEKAKILYIIKSKKPASLYHLAKILNRDFKAVSKDIKLLERFGFIDIIRENTGKRKKLRPILTVNSINIKIKL